MKEYHRLVRAVAFDLDHTLYDRNATWDNLCNICMQFFASQLDPGLSRDRALSLLRETDYIATYTETSWAGMYEELLQRGFFDSPPGLPAFRSFIDRYFPPAIVPYPDTYRVLTWLKDRGFRPSIITNGHRGLQEDKIRHMGLEKYAEEIIICDLDSGVGCKPAPEGFLELAGRLRTAPAEMMYVGDNPVNDIQGARNAGLQTVWLNVMKNWVPHIPPADYEISCLEELCPLLIRINEAQ